MFVLLVSQKHLRFATLEDVEREGTFVGKGLYKQIKKEYYGEEGKKFNLIYDFAVGKVIVVIYMD